MEKVKCPICKTQIDDNPYVSICPYCKWTYTGVESVYEEDEKDDFNLISREQAKDKLKNGFDKYGNPLKTH